MKDEWGACGESASDDGETSGAPEPAKGREATSTVRRCSILEARERGEIERSQEETHFQKTS